MARTVTTVDVLYVLAMVAVIIGVDIVFFRHHVPGRLTVNVGVVLVFGAVLSPVLPPFVIPRMTRDCRRSAWRTDRLQAGQRDGRRLGSQAPVRCRSSLRSTPTEASTRRTNSRLSLES